MPSLGNDLATIRKRQDLSVEDIQQITKIPRSILTSIEDDSIFDQINDNTTYTRSYVRSYGRALGIEERKILKALNQLQTGTYDGNLIEKKREDMHESPELPDKEESTPEPEAKTVQPAEAEPDQKVETKKKTNKNKKKKKKTRSRFETSPDDWDWVQVGKKRKTSSWKSSNNRLLLWVLIIAVIAAGIFVYFYFFAGSGTAITNQPPSSQAVTRQPIPPIEAIPRVFTSTQNASASLMSSPLAYAPQI